MRDSRKTLFQALVVVLSCSILGGANRCADCGEGTYYSETGRKCLPKLGEGVQVDTSSGMIVAQLSDEAVAALQVSMLGLQNRIETLETTTTNHTSAIAANTDVVTGLPSFEGWDTNVADDFDGSYTSLSSAPVALAALATYLDVNQTNHLITVSGANLKITDGTGSTACSGGCSGLGNVIVGYDEGAAQNKEGAHNLVVGPDHTYLSYAGFVAGRQNSLEAEFGSVCGGYGNVVSAEHASISGGVDNSATGDGASVSGGRLNSAQADASWVGGGESNRAEANYSSVTGGSQVEASNVHEVAP